MCEKRRWPARPILTSIEVLAILGVLVAVPVLANPPARAPEVDEARTFQAQIEEASRDSGIPGLVFALREPGGGDFVGAVGISDIGRGIPMRADNRFYVGSISQSMLAAVVFMLDEEGKLTLDDPLSDFMKFPGGEAVTVRMLLDHSSGFADWTGRDLAATDNPGLPELLKMPQTADRLIKLAAEGNPIFRPGEKQEACYTNMLLITKLIENVEGRSASTVIEDRIFRPLGMTSTCYLKAGEKLASLAMGYRAETGWGHPLPDGLTEAGWADDNLRALADQGIVSTAKDILRYHVGLREGKLISAESWKKMHTVRPGKINGLGYLVLAGARGTWEGNTGHAVGHLSINLYQVEKGFYLVVMGNLGDTGLPVAKFYDIRYGRRKPSSDSPWVDVRGREPRPPQLTDSQGLLEIPALEGLHIDRSDGR
jgi:D-alanyl-D-alanine carboxypeptidase